MFLVGSERVNDVRNLTGSGRDQHGVDDVHDAVGAVHIGGSHLGNAVDGNDSVSNRDGDVLALDGLDGDGAAVHRLADVVVGLADDDMLHAVEAEGAERLARRARVDHLE